MNCKPGDLAIVVKTAAGQQTGITVRCLHLFTGTFVDGTPAAKARYQWWVIDRELRYPFGFAALCADRCLMPIRPIADVTETQLCLEVDTEGKPT